MGKGKDVAMLGFSNEYFYLDVTELEKFLLLNNKSKHIVAESTTEYYDEKGKITGKTVIINKDERGKQYDTIKYEMIRYLFECLSLEMEDVDSSLGIEKAMEKMPLPAKLAFNTLAGYGILKKFE